MIVGHLEECLFNLFAYFKIVLFLLDHRSPLYTVGTKPLCKYFLLFCQQFLAYSFCIHLHARVLYFLQFYIEDRIYCIHNVSVIFFSKDNSAVWKFHISTWRFLFFFSSASVSLFAHSVSLSGCSCTCCLQSPCFIEQSHMLVV